MTSRVEELQRMCDSINENGGLNSGEWHTALLAQIAQNLAFIADVMMADRKTEPQSCDTCRHKGVEGCEQPCLGCGCCGLYEAITGDDKLKEKVVEFIKSCARCKHRPIGAMMCEESCHYEPKDEPSGYKTKPVEVEPTISKMEQVEYEPQTDEPMEKGEPDEQMDR